MSTSIESSPTLRWASRSAKSSIAAGRAFKALTPGGEKLLTPGGDPPSGLTRLAGQQVQGLAAQQTHQTHHHPLLAPSAPAHFALIG